MLDRSQCLMYSPQGHGGPFGLEPEIHAGGAAALASKIGRYDPSKWGGFYCEMCRDPFNHFSNITWHDEGWAADFQGEMSIVVKRFAGIKIAYLGISDADLNMPIKRAVSLWYETMRMIRDTGFTHVGIDAFAHSPHLRTFVEAPLEAGLEVLVEGAPRVLHPQTDGFIVTTEEYRKGAGEWLTVAEQGKDMTCVVVDNGNSHDEDLTKEQWKDPELRPFFLRHFVAQVRGQGGWPALVPWDPALRVNAALPGVPQ